MAAGLRSVIAILLTLAAAVPCGAASASEPVHVANAWIRATAPGQQAAGAYFDLTSSVAAALVAAESPAAGKAELHTMTMDDGVMRMRALDKVELPAQRTIRFAPGGLHVMLTGITKPLRPGDRVPLMLTVQTAGGVKSTLKVVAEVRAAEGAKPHHHH